MALLARPVLSPVRVVFLVARVARGRELIPVEVAFVTGFACDRSVLTTQGVLGVAPVVEHHTLPAPVGVAGLARLTEITLVCIVLPVAADTGALQCCSGYRPLVALFTFDSSMLTLEREFRVPAMVERRCLPILLGMAGLASTAKVALVGVVFFVTGIAGPRRVLESALRMACSAVNLRVRAAQREARGVMIELSGLPGTLGMTLCTGLSQGPFMHVVFFVAGVTVGRGLSVFVPRFVATPAFHVGAGMGAVEGKISAGVVECAVIDRCNISRPPLVFRVAHPAFALLVHAPVEPFLLRNIPGHLFVAILAALGLSRLIERDVTAVATRLKLGVVLNHLARHEHAFQNGGPSGQ